MEREQISKYGLKKGSLAIFILSLPSPGLCHPADYTPNTHIPTILLNVTKVVHLPWQIKPATASQSIR